MASLEWDFNGAVLSKCMLYGCGHDPRWLLGLSDPRLGSFRTSTVEYRTVPWHRGTGGCVLRKAANCLAKSAVKKLVQKISRRVSHP